MKKIAVFLMIGLLFPSLAFAQKGKQVKNVVKALKSSGEAAVKVNGNQLYAVYPYGKMAPAGAGLSGNALSEIERVVSYANQSAAKTALQEKIGAIGKVKPALAQSLSELAEENFSLAERAAQLFEEITAPYEKNPEDVLCSLLVFLQKNRRFPEVKVFDASGEEVLPEALSVSQKAEMALRKDVETMIGLFPGTGAAQKINLLKEAYYRGELFSNASVN